MRKQITISEREMSDIRRMLEMSRERMDASATGRMWRLIRRWERAKEQGKTISIEEAEEAFCKSHGCRILSSTCVEGTCMAFDAFAKALCEQKKGGKE